MLRILENLCQQPHSALCTAQSNTVRQLEGLCGASIKALHMLLTTAVAAAGRCTMRLESTTNVLAERSVLQSLLVRCNSVQCLELQLIAFYNRHNHALSSLQMEVCILQISELASQQFLKQLIVQS